MKSLFAAGDSSGMRDAAVLHHLRPPRSRGSIDTFATGHPHRAHVINTRRRGHGQQELRLQGLVKRSCIRRTPRPDTTGGGSLSNARAAESAVLLFATGGRGTPSGRNMHTPARARQR